MKMVLHERIRKYVDRERGRAIANQTSQPFLSVRGRIPTQKRSPHAAADQVVNAGHIIVDHQGTGNGHDGSSIGPQQTHFNSGREPARRSSQFDSDDAPPEGGAPSDAHTIV